MAMLLDIRGATGRKDPHRAAILRMIGGDSLEPRLFREKNITKAPSCKDKDPDAAPSPMDVPVTQTPVEDERYAHFRRLLKVGVPRQKIESDMRNQGLNPAGLDGSVPDETNVARAQTITPVGPLPVSTVRRRWHFAEVPTADRAPAPADGSCWGRRSRGGQLPDTAGERIDRLFVKVVGDAEDAAGRTSSGQADCTTDNNSNGESAPQPTKQGSVMILKRDKALTLEIALKTVKTSLSDVAEEIKILSGSSLKDTAIKTILSMWPSIAEQRGLDEYSEHFDSLGRCEQFLITIRKVPRAKEKLRCLLLKKEFPRRVHELREMTLLVTRALNQLCKSSEFEAMLHVILDIANYLNWGEVDKEYRSSFSLKSLSKLTHTKSFDGSLTLLDTIVDCIQIDYALDLMHFLDGIKLISLCKAVSVDALRAEMDQLRKGHEMLVAESHAAARGSSRGYPSDKDADRSRQALSELASIVNEELGSVQKLFSGLEESKSRFLSKFEESLSTSIDNHLAVIAQFVTELKTSAAKAVCPNQFALK